MILANRGLRFGKRGRLTSKLPDDPTGKKSPLMRYVEDKFRQNIEDIIWQGSAAEISEKIEVDVRTIRRWRQVFPLENYKIGKNNRKLPIAS